ncbi:MAG: HAMP domain-containing histidine kinase, partial [Blastomonas sp.]|nr:HAMP domain-containing histidine kinase [Blastomonas sp.]
LAAAPADPRGALIHLDRLGRVVRFVPPADYAAHDAAETALLKPLSALLHDTDGLAVDDPEQIDGHRVTLRDDDRAWIATFGGDPAVTGGVVTLTEAPCLPDAPGAPSLPPLFDGERIGHLFGTQIGPALRQPIARIIANAETIGGRLEGPLRADYAGYASDIASAGRHLLALVDDLADLEAIEASGFSAAREPVDLADVARRAAGLLALKAADRKIRIDKPAEEDSLPAIGEFRRVLQVLLNLLGNAINYAPDGSMIWLRMDEGPDWVSITIADQGPGLSADDQQRLFNKWERLGRSGDGGSGLGLYISRRLALAMDGDLTVESAPGQGARFTLILPKG